MPHQRGNGIETKRWQKLSATNYFVTTPSLWGGGGERENACLRIAYKANRMIVRNYGINGHGASTNVTFNDVNKCSTTSNQRRVLVVKLPRSDF